MSISKKILQVQLRYNVNESDLAEQLVVGLMAQGIEVTTLFLRGKPASGMPASKAQHSHYFECGPGDLKGFRRWLIVFRLYRFLRANGFDAVIAHRFKPISMMMWLSQLFRPMVFVGVQHGIGDYDRFFRRVEAAVLISRRWKIVGVSRAVTSYLQRTVHAFNEQNTVTINNAIDINRAKSIMLSAQDARAALALPEGRLIIGCIGRLVPVKGHATLISAFSRIAEDYPDTLVAIIGEGRTRFELEALVREHGLQQRVILLGARDDALKYVKAFDIFAMPSFSEGLPLALLEALAGGRPVIGSDIESLTAILEDCGGLQFKAGDSVDLAGKLLELIRKAPEQREAMGKAGHDYLCRMHGIEDFRFNYRTLILEMIQASGKK